MGTRAGDIDVGAVLHMARSESLDLDGIDRVLNRESGLLGLSDLSNDCRDSLKKQRERGMKVQNVRWLSLSIGLRA